MLVFKVRPLSLFPFVATADLINVGLADAFLALRMPFESPQAKQLNIQIFETIYHAAVEASTELAEIQGPYSTYEGSPASKGQLQYDLWGVTPTDLWDWDELKEKVKKHGLRNSLLVAPMPTASTSQILGFNECFEPYTSNIYSRRVLAGEFQIVNPWLLKDLVDMGLWSDNMKNRIIADNGSIQNIPNIPDDIKALYKTVWEISQKKVIEVCSGPGYRHSGFSLTSFIDGCRPYVDATRLLPGRC